MVAAAADNAAARVLDIRRDDIGQLAESHAASLQVFRPRLDHKLPFVSAAFVNLGDTRHGPQQRLDGVVMKFAQLEQLLPEQFRSFCVGLVGNIVVENFTQSGADRCELRRDVVWQTLHRGLQALGHELARAINICVVGKLESDLRQAELCQRTHLFDARQSGHLNFDGPGHQFFRFLRGQGRHFRIYLDLHTGDVGNGVNRQPSGRPETDSNQSKRGEQNKRALSH